MSKACSLVVWQMPDFKSKLSAGHSMTAYLTEAASRQTKDKVNLATSELGV